MARRGAGAHEPPDTALLDPELAEGAPDDRSDPVLERDPVAEPDDDPELDGDLELDDPELLDAADVVPDDPACVEPGNVKATAPPATTLATPMPAVMPRSRRPAWSRAAIARRTSVDRTFISFPCRALIG
jgi:hypothetical protein